MKVLQGDIVTIEFPYSNLSETKRRPALVLSNSAYNNHKNLILAGIYGKETYGSIAITNDNLKTKRLKKDSWVSLQNIFSAEKSLLGPVVDTVNAATLQTILSKVHSCF